MENEEAKPQEETVQPEKSAKKSGKAKKILLIIGGIFILLIVLGSRGGNQSQQATTTSETKETVATPTVREAMKITASELADDFDANQVAAEEKWKGKLVEFSAEISNITETGISFQNVASKDFSLTQISCRIKDKQQLLPLKNGQSVTVRGVVGEQTIGVIDVSQCEIVD